MASDLFITFKGAGGTGVSVKGETKDKAKKADTSMELIAFSWGLNNPAHIQGGGMSAGKSHFSDLSVQKYMDAGSAMLMTACATGEHFPEVVVTARRAGGEQNDYQQITLKEVLVTSYNNGANDGGGLATESVGLAYAKIQVDYFGQDEKGAKEAAPKTFTYDLPANAK